MIQIWVEKWKNFQNQHKKNVNNDWTFFSLDHGSIETGATGNKQQKKIWS